MKRHFPDGSLIAATLVALALFATAIFLRSTSVSAKPESQPQSLTVPAGQAVSCLIEGATYPVDRQGQIWAIGNRGRWFVTGHLEHGAEGVIATRADGRQSPAVCQ